MKIDSQKVSDRERTFAKGLTVVARVGKRKFAKVSVAFNFAPHKFLRRA